MGNLFWAKFQRFWFPVILYSGIIFCVSSMPNVRTPLPDMHLDTIIHLLIYMPFGFLLARAIYGEKGVNSRGLLLGAVVLFSFLYGCSDEIHQSFVPGRSAEIMDLIADTIGGAVGGRLFLLFLGIRKSK